MNEHLNFEDGWRVLEGGILKCSKMLEGCTGAKPSVAEYMNCYDCAYRMASQKYQYCQEMYDGYKATLAECVRTMVLPHLMHKHDEDFLREFAVMWSNYRHFVKLVFRFFCYLDRCFVHQRKLPSLADAAATSFFNPVFSYFNHEVTDALLTQIRQEREGIKIDVNLLIDLMRGICRSEVNASMKNAVLQDTYTYYSRKSSEWILQYSLPDYLDKVEESMKNETNRLIQYLCINHAESSKLCLQAVKAPMMQTYDNYSRVKHTGGGLLLQTYMTVKEELVAKCNGLTLDNSSDNISCGHME